MKTFLVIIVVVGLFVGIQSDPIDKDKAEDKAKEVTKELFNGYRKECIKQTGIEEQIVMDARYKGVFPDDPKLKSYGLCLAKKLGLQNEKGDLQMDVIREKLHKKVEDNKLGDEIFEKCVIQKDTPENTAFDGMKCFWANVPKHCIV